MFYKNEVLKKCLLKLLFICLSASIVFAYSGGTGEPNTPYQIATVSDWNDLMHTSADWTKHFIMTADVNLQGMSLTPIGKSSPKFKGMFNGNDHIVRNADINMPTTDSVGLFGYIYSDGQIYNLGAENLKIIGRNWVGGLVGYNESGSNISNCHFTGTVSGTSQVGGLVGFNSGNISNCYSSGSVSGSSRYVGGLIGDNKYCSISNCYSTGTVSGFSSIGGLVGNNYDSNIVNCHFTGTVSGTGAIGGLAGYSGISCNIINCYSNGSVSGSPDSYNVGGLIGFNTISDVSNCYSTSAVSGNHYVGGLLGETETCSISYSYSTGTVSGSTDVGGLAGDNFSANISNCYSTGNVSGTTYAGGLVGASYGSTNRINNCYSTGAVSGSSTIGGLVGHYESGILSNCYSTGTVSGSSDYLGGLLGHLNSGIVSACYSTGDVTGFGYGIGGLAGSISGTISNCYSKGTVSGYQRVGGLVGEINFDGSVSNCYSTGPAGGNLQFGGLIGFAFELPGSGSNFWDVNTSGLIDGVGNMNPDPAGETGKTTAQMKTLSTFTSAGWDFTTPLWKICDGTNYPKLAWQIPLAGDFNCPDGVDIFDLAVFTDQWLLEKLSFDTNSDGIVNFLDFAAFANNWHGDMNKLFDFSSQWLQRSAYNADIAPAPTGDGIVNFLDFALFAESWLKQ